MRFSPSSGIAITTPASDNERYVDFLIDSVGILLLVGIKNDEFCRLLLASRLASAGMLLN